jgi:hypothetical protein
MHLVHVVGGRYGGEYPPQKIRFHRGTFEVDTQLPTSLIDVSETFSIPPMPHDRPCACVNYIIEWIILIGKRQRQAILN